VCLFVCSLPGKVAEVVVPVALPAAAAFVVAIVVVVLIVVCKHFHFVALLGNAFRFSLAVSSYVINLHLTKFA